ncbi:MAG: hypothetical protein MJ133_08810 [Lachnospiraceae bacterium]|nr:hypothetical protein [Lachnospiraceae bacterium]
MAAPFINGMVNREVSFCRVHSIEAKDKLEKLLLDNRISYFVEWKEYSFITKLFNPKVKNSFVFKINEEDLAKARLLVAGSSDVENGSEETEVAE